MRKVTVLGGGGWAIALAVLLNDNGHRVSVWSAVEREVKELSTVRENKTSLPGVIIPESVEITNDLESAVKGADVIVMAVASSFVRETAKKLARYVSAGQVIVNVAKGIESGTLFTMTQIIEDEIPGADVAVLSGPSHAEEVGRKMPTAIVAGAKSHKTALFIQSVFSSSCFRVYTSPDIISIELGGALKNVIALAAGVADGLGYGDNTKAAIITRGIKEISALGMAMGGHLRTFMGLSGIGDLIVTCASMHSRNRRAGILIGQGKSLDEAVKEVHMVVEGAVCAEAALKLARKNNVELPITEQINKVLFEGKPAKEAVDELMNREYTNEHEDMLWQ